MRARGGWGFTAALAFGLAAGHAAAEKLVIKGSNTFGETLGPRLIEEFRKQHPEIEVDIETRGSGSGFAALLAGECDLASSSRVANEDEQRLARSRGIALKSQVVGSYGVAVVVNAASPVRSLTDAQVRDIFTGSATNWSGVGGADAPIRLFIRDSSSGTHLGFQELAMERRPYGAGATALASYADILAAVRADPWAIGYSDMRLAGVAGVRAVKINGVPPSPYSVNEQMYPYAREIRLYARKGAEAPAAKAFLSFVRSKRGQQVVEEMGYVPHTLPRSSRIDLEP